MAESNKINELIFPEDIEDYGSHFTESAFKQKLRDLPRSALSQTLEKALLLWELLMDDNSPIWVRTIIIGTLGYLIMPLDLVPDFIPGAGFLDDAAALAVALIKLDEFVTDDIRARTRRKLPGFLG